MYETIIGIDGMMCGMCEAHIKDAIRASLSVKKVMASHTKNQAVIRSEEEVPENIIRKVIDKTGYKVVSVTSRPYKKKGFFR